MKEVTIFTDGASKGNPGPGGWGAVIATGSVVREIGGGEKQTTNNRMELAAIIGALRMLEKAAEDAKNGSRKNVTIFSDSSYAIHGATKWIYGWQKKNWMTAQKQAVENRDLWEEVARLLQSQNVTFQKVSGHTGVRGNERANDIAEEFARGKAPTLFSGERESYGIDLSNTDSQHAKKTSSKNRGKAYSYVSLLDGKLETHKTWEECKHRVHGTPARFKKAFSKEDEARIIAEFSQK